jgi:hypothetical protein
MLHRPPHVKIHLCQTPLDLRESVDARRGMVESLFGKNMLKAPDFCSRCDIATGWTPGGRVGKPRSSVSSAGHAAPGKGHGQPMADGHSGFPKTELRNDARIVLRNSRCKIFGVPSSVPRPASFGWARIGQLDDLNQRDEGIIVNERRALRERESRPVQDRVGMYVHSEAPARVLCVDGGEDRGRNRSAAMPSARVVDRGNSLRSRSRRADAS